MKTWATFSAGGYLHGQTVIKYCVLLIFLRKIFIFWKIVITPPPVQLYTSYSSRKYKVGTYSKTSILATSEQ